MTIVCDCIALSGRPFGCGSLPLFRRVGEIRLPWADLFQPVGLAIQGRLRKLSAEYLWGKKRLGRPSYKSLFLQIKTVQLSRIPNIQQTV